jgi:flagellar biosynthetic protein FlhB
VEESTEEKEFAATDRRLDEARRRGEFPMGRDLLGAAATGGLALAAVAAPGSLIDVADAMMTLFDQADQLAPLLGSGEPALMGGLGLSVMAGLLPWFGLPILAVVATLFAQGALVFAPARLEPKLSKISPIQGVKNKFGRNGLFEFAKGAVKLTIYAIVLGVYLGFRADMLMAAMALEPGQVTALLARLVLEFLLLILIIQASIGAIDLLWQRAEHQRKQRMTRKEMTDEMKQSDGDPQMKAQRRQKAVDIASNRMLSEVPKADVIIVNPTHYAVALKWNRKDKGAPVLVAKGVDEVAARIREIAAEAGVPLRRDPATARAIHAAVELGQEIRPEHYRPVAAAIRFAEAMRRRARAQGNRGTTR